MGCKANKSDKEQQALGPLLISDAKAVGAAYEQLGAAHE